MNRFVFVALILAKRHPDYNSMEFSIVNLHYVAQYLRERAEANERQKERERKKGKRAPSFLEQTGYLIRIKLFYYAFEVRQEIKIDDM